MKKAKVDNQERIFYVQVGSMWVSAFGHRLEYDGYQFAAISAFDKFFIYEESSGAYITNVPIEITHEMQLGTHDGLLFYLEMVVGSRLQDVIDQTDDFNKRIQRVKRKNEKRLGKKPTTKNYSKEWEKFVQGKEREDVSETEPQEK